MISFTLSFAFMFAWTIVVGRRQLAITACFLTVQRLRIGDEPPGLDAP